MQKELEYSVAEEVIHAFTHGVGVLLSIAGLTWMLYVSIGAEDPWRIVASSIYGATLIGLFLASTIYHSMYRSRHREIFKLLDHCAIYLLIAGTYTPIVLGVLYGAWGWTLFGLVWGLALAGIILKSVSGVKYHGISLVIYVAMGWIVVIAVEPLLEAMPAAGIAWLVAGGVCYTGGIWFYRHEQMPYAHTIWHLFVIAGTVCHVVAIMGYGLGPELANESGVRARNLF